MYNYFHWNEDFDIPRISHAKSKQMLLLNWTPSRRNSGRFRTLRSRSQRALLGITDALPEVFIQLKTQPDMMSDEPK